MADYDPHRPRPFASPSHESPIYSKQLYPPMNNVILVKQVNPKTIDDMNKKQPSHIKDRCKDDIEKDAKQGITILGKVLK